MSRTKHILSYSIPIVILLFFLFGSFFAPHDPTATNIRGKYLSSSAEYPFGTDDFGRCEFSRILEGGKITLGIVLVGSATAIVRAFKASQAMGRAAREPCGGETPLELRQQPPVLSFPFVVLLIPMKGGLVSMETPMKKTASPIVREYKIGDITYIVKAVVKDGAKEDAVTKVRRLIQNDLRGKKVTNNFEPA